jgi:hypothetical protein
MSNFNNENDAFESIIKEALPNKMITNFVLVAEVIDSETGEIVKLFNPRTQIWSEHFFWTKDGLQIVGKTPTGRATVKVLHLSDDADALEVRSYWVLAGWHPPEN